MIFEVPIPKLTRQKPKEIRKATLEICNTHLVYFMDFDADEPINSQDLEMGWEERTTWFHNIIIKEFVSSFDLEYVEDSKTWCIHLMVVGASEVVRIFFKRMGDAEKVFDAIYKWRFNII